MDDLISRQAAIDALRVAYWDDNIQSAKNDPCIVDAMTDWAIRQVKALPHAQPEPCEDAVSREEVLNCLEWQYPDKTPRTKIMELPPVTPKQRTGHWQITDAYPHNVYCSECHKRFAQTHWAVWEDGSLPRNFCPNCGCRMEGSAE